MTPVTDALVAAAKGWRGMARLVLLVVPAEDAAVQEVVVKLGEARRRWKRVAAAIAPMEQGIIGARGYDAKGELVGAWDAPDDESDDTEPELQTETDAMTAHRLHTQWCLREAAKMYEASTRLTVELVGAVVEVIRVLRGNVSTPTSPEQPTTDDATRTLGMLLQMASQNNRSATDETERDEGGPRSDADRQGQPEQSAQAGT